jgi:serine-type D-Ala-D-Ala carboxypeptidase/endopeptidase
MRRWLWAAVGLSIACGDDAAPGLDASVDAFVPESDAGRDSGAPDAGPASREDAVREMYERYVAAGWLDSASIALVGPEGDVFIGVGRLSASDARAPDPDTLYEIGSISKVFTGLLLAQLIEAGEVAPEQTIDSLLPEPVMVPGRSGLEITLVNVTTHRSGLPRLADNMPFADPGDPYADYTTELLYEFLNGYSLPRDPGASYEYSNLAVGLLGHGLGRRAGSDWRSALEARVLMPLGLADTTPEPSAEQLSRLAPPHDADRFGVDSWHFQDSSGAAGALRSTARDLATFARAQIDPSSAGGLGPAIERSQLAVTDFGAEADIGYGWFLLEDGALHFHNGGTGGYLSFLIVDRSAGLALVALLNTSIATVSDRLGFAAFDVWRGGDPTIPMPPPAVVVPSETLDAYVGRYNTIANTAEIARDGDRLFLRIDAQPRVGIYPTAETEFELRAVEASVTFVRDGAAPARQLVLHQGGEDYVFRRE